MSDDKEEKLSHPIYISAGMAAAGMGSKISRRKRKSEVPTDEPDAIIAVEEEEKGEETEEPQITKDVEDAEVAESKAIEEAEVSEPEIEKKPASESLPEEDLQEQREVEEGDPVSAEDSPDEVSVADEQLRKVVVLGIEAEDALREIFSKIGNIEIATPGDLDDFCEFIEKEKPELVVVATTGNGDHYDLAKTSLESGAQVFCTVPFTRTLKEADALVAIAESKALTLSIGNALASHPTVVGALKQREDLIGDLLEMRVFGEMGNNAGGEDLLVNGALLFDVVRLFGGEANWCNAEVTQRGERAMGEHIFHSTEANLGQLLGDRIHARFEMDSGVFVNFISDRRAKNVTGPCGIEFIGSKSIMRLQVSGDEPPVLTVLQNPESHEVTRKNIWQQWSPTEASAGSPPLENWLAAIDSSVEPACSGLSALKSLEMVHAVWQASLTGKRAYFPLVTRLHPLNEELL